MTKKQNVTILEDNDEALRVLDTLENIDKQLTLKEQCSCGHALFNHRDNQCFATAFENIIENNKVVRRGKQCTCAKLDIQTA